MRLVQRATPLARGFDTDTPLNAASAARLRAAGLDFVVRYLPDMRTTELNAILSAGLAVMGVSHVRMPGWSPNAGMGHVDGTNVAAAAQSAGLLSGTTLWCDIEGVSSSCSATDVIVYANAWTDAVATAGFEPGMYVGASSILSASQWYHAIKAARYWRSGSLVVEPETRGFCMIQESPLDVTVAGIQIDRDTVHADKLGDLPSWTCEVEDVQIAA